MGGGGFNNEPVAPPTSAGLSYKKKLYILMVIHTVMAFLIMFELTFF